MNNQDVQTIASKGFPWGLIFATRINFEFGYFTEEGCLVDKYLGSPENVLVIGAGNGREARPIHRLAKRIICSDIGWLYLKSAQQLFRKEGITNTYLISADMLHLPFAKESFDFVFFSLYSFAGADRFTVLQDIRALLRPAGRLLLTCRTPYSKKIDFNIPPECIFISSADELRKEISSCGFELLETMVDSKRPEYRFSILQAKVQQPQGEDS